MENNELKDKIEELISNSVYPDWECGEDGDEYCVERVNETSLRDNLVEFIKELLTKNKQNIRKLYLLSQNDNNDYDTYDSIVVCAENEECAKKIDPYGNEYTENAKTGTWANKLSSIQCIEIGEADEKQEIGVIIASFNAG